MRRDYKEFVARDAEVLAVGPDSVSEFRAYWDEKNMPFPGLPDPDHRVADVYRQQVNWLKLGRMPALFVIDKEGRIRYQHHGAAMMDIPPNAEVLALLDKLNQESAPHGA